MKVLHVLNNYLPNQVAGTEVYVSRLVNELQLKKIESIIVIPNTKNLTEEYNYENIRVIKYAETSSANREIISGKKSPEGLVQFLNIIKLENPDLIHFHELAGSIGIGMFHVRGVKALGYKSLITFHVVKYSCPTGSLIYLNEKKCDGKIRNLRCSNCISRAKGLSRLQALILKFGFTILFTLKIDISNLNNSFGTALAMPFLVRKTKSVLFELQESVYKIIVLTNWYKNILVVNGLTDSKITVIEQGVTNLCTSSYRIQSHESCLRIVFIGRISEIKGVDFLVNVVKDLPVNKISLDIYGSYSEDQYFKKILDLISSSTNIKWKGEVEPSLVIQTLSEYDVLCVPSRIAEMGPLVLKEAFAAGLPVLGSNVYGNQEQIKHNVNGWLFSINDSKSLKNQLLQLLENPTLIKVAKQNIKPVRDIKAVGDDHIRLYKEVLKY